MAQFEQGESYVVAYSPRAHAIADFNNDGAPDIVAAVFDRNGFDILFGRGDGTFDPAVHHPIGTLASRVVAADLNEDGNIDILMVAWPGIHVYNGNGTGGFDLGQTIVVPRVQRLIVGDFGGGSGTDLAALTAYFDGSSASFVMLRNTGGVLSVFAETLSAGGRSHGFAIADLDADGVPDLCSINSLTDETTFYRGSVTGFQPIAPPLAMGDRPRFPAFADVNLDGLPDLVILRGLTDGTAATFISTGPFRFAPFLSSAVGSNAEGLAVGDFNLDGIPDIVTANSRSGVMVSTGDLSGMFHSQYVSDPNVWSHFVTTGDLDSDGRLDFVVAATGTNRVIPFLNRSVRTHSTLLAPRSTAACPRGSAVFEAHVDGPAPDYQWQRELGPGTGLFGDLSDGTTDEWDGEDLRFSAVISGASTPTLTISAPPNVEQRLGSPHAIRYRCTIRNGCSDLDGQIVSLRICISDTDCDGETDADDIVTFFTAWDNSDTLGDADLDGDTDSDDIITFFTAWDAGC